MSFTFTQAISGSSAAASSVSVSNFPATQTVTGSVGVINLMVAPFTTPLSGATQATNLLDALVVGQYNTSSVSMTHGQIVPIQLDVSGNMKTHEQFGPLAEDDVNNVYAVHKLPLTTATYCRTSVFPTALTTSFVVKNSPGTLRSCSGRIDKTQTTGDFYFQLFNTAVMTAEGTGVASMLCDPLAIQHVNGTHSRFSLDFSEDCIAFTTGLCAVLSTTENTKTATTSSVMRATFLIK